MRRYLSDRGSYWGGGAYRGTELPWEAIGHFGCQPAHTVNTLRYDWGSRAFGEKNALAFLQFHRAYERLWDFMNALMMPYACPTIPGTAKINIKFAWNAGTQKYADWDYVLMGKQVMLKWE